MLVAEDEYLLADDLAQALRAAGAIPVGPVGTLSQAEAKAGKGGLNGAVLDMNLRGETAFGLAQQLAAAGVPCVIVSGYSEQAVPAVIAGIRRLEKPVDTRAVIDALAAQMGAAAR